VQPGAPTVQGTVAAALRPLAGPGLRLIGASRTDAGVHALGQVASVHAARPLVARVVQAALNATLPGDIRVAAAREVPAGFDARRAARLKRYAYVMSQAPVVSPFLRRYVWHVARPLDLAGLRLAARGLRGRHDFSAFQAAAGRDRDPVCRLRSIRVVDRGPLIAVVVSGDAFLHHMVRNIVGTLAEVGRGRHPAAWVAEVLAGRDRRHAGPTAPPQGLCLTAVRYADPLFPGLRFR
jgi:tRNA pseudouridine38-40 synthase